MAKLRISEERRLGVDLADAELGLIDQLVAFRHMRGLRQEDVADRMGVDRTTVNRFENSGHGSPRNHTLLTVKRYAEAVEAFIAHFVVDGKINEQGKPTYTPLQHHIDEHLDRLESDDYSKADDQKIQDSVAHISTIVQISSASQWKSPPQPENTYTWSARS